MTTYEYEHEGEGCKLGKTFFVEQSMKDDALKTCPECSDYIERLIAPAFMNTPTGDSDLRDKGFAKLVRRDKGVYENVTALDGESRYWDANKPGSMPDIQKRIGD